LKTNNADYELDEDIIQTVKDTKPQDVQLLIKLTQIKHPLSEKQILNRILLLQDKGKIQLRANAHVTGEKLSDYLRSSQAAWYWATLVLTAGSVIATSTVSENAGPLVSIRYVLGTIFILWLPGYTFIKALFPQTPLPKPATGLTHTIQNLDTIERTALSIGLSLALVPITGLLLNYTPWGIRLAPITLSLTALTLTFATAALLRENQTRRKHARYV
jgi:hypothetical protein